MKEKFDQKKMKKKISFAWNANIEQKAEGFSQLSLNLSWKIRGHEY